MGVIGGFFGGVVRLFTGGGVSGFFFILLLGASLGGWGAWKTQGWRHQVRDAQRVEAQAKAEREARADEMVKVRNNERISDEHTTRTARTLARAAAAERAAAGLRNEVQRLNGRDLPTDPGAAGLAREARAARDLLGRCAEAYRRVDERAQGLGDQVTGLQAFAVDVCKAGKD